MFLAFSPARISNHSRRRFPPNAFATPASKTRTLARQMSGPVPSPSMNGMIGSSGTTSCPFLREIGVPLVGGFSEVKFGIVFWSGHLAARGRFPRTLWKSLWKRHRVYVVVMRSSECFSGLHHSRASRHVGRHQTSSKAVFRRNEATLSGKALEAVLAAAQRPPSNEDSRTDRSLSLGGLRRSFVTHQNSRIILTGPQE